MINYNKITINIMSLIISAIIFGIMAFVKNAKRKPVQQRIAYLYGEIDKLNRALNKGSAII